jgi:hypothetical protein
VNGLPGRGVAAVVVVHVTNTGSAATAGLTATITLPPGVTLLGLARLTGSGQPSWTCSDAQAGTSACQRGPLAAGATTSVAVRVVVTILSGCGQPVLASVVSGALSASGQSAGLVQCAGR